MRSSALLCLGATACLLSPVASTPTNSSGLPIVDLGYALQRASGFNSSGKYYDFSNIAYAQPPTGALRFAAPKPPLTNRSVVQDGLVPRICPQGFQAWLIAAQSHSAPPKQPLPQDPTVSEDCLLLDVAVPEAVFSKRSSKSRGAPVLVWIHGGGLTLGSKTRAGSPAGLIAESQRNQSSDGIVYVGINYRLGAFGFLNGPDVRTNGAANAGILDQRLALDWVQQNIAKFGGDPNRVTVLGESAGGSSIMHHLTAYAGAKGKVPFQRAIAQSPAFFPTPGNYQQQEVTDLFLSKLNVTTIDQARALPAEKLISTNSEIVFRAPVGASVFGVTVDGSYVPALPGQLLAEGKFDKDVQLMVGHNSDEGRFFADPNVQSEAQFADYVKSFFPSIPPTVLNNVTTNLYPPVGNTTLYNSQFDRVTRFISDMLIECNTDTLNRALNRTTYPYLFSVAPGLHTQDIAYTFYNGPSPNITAPAVANQLQSYLINFAVTGNPNGPGLPQFTTSGPNAQILNLNVTGAVTQADNTVNERCSFWQRGLYF